jgi:hypothetical protein
MERRKNKVDETTGDFYGRATGILENQSLRLEYLLTAGPRIVRLSFKQGANLFAELPHVSATTNLGIYNFRGGHRLWRSPELMPESYTPDNDNVIVRQIRNGAALTQNVENGISKSIEIILDPNLAEVTLHHHLRNTGTKPVTLAAWPITMFRLGGVGIFPQNETFKDPSGLLPNRHLVFWPYTDIQDPRLKLKNDFVLLHAVPAKQPLKIGYRNYRGWMGYFLDGALFIKSFSTQGDEQYPDIDANCEFYCNDQVFELETLSPLVHLNPGREIIHTEKWQVLENLDSRIIPDHLVKLIMHLILATKSH